MVTTRTRRTIHSRPGLLLGALALAACSGEGGGGGGAESGTVTETWADFCTAVFTEETAIEDSFGNPLFTARVGDEFLLADFSESSGGRAELVYLTRGGPETFDLNLEDVGSWPFTSNCDIGAGVPYYAAFTDVVVFAEAELTTKLCEIAAGTTLPAEGFGRGYAFNTALPSGNAVYEVVLGPFGAQCGGETSGFVSVPRSRPFENDTWLVPLVGIIGPD